MGIVIYKLDKKHERWYVRDTTKDFHTQYGPIRKESLKPGKTKIDNHEFFIVEAAFLDDYKAIERKAQIITRKDIGFIVGYCALGRDSVVVEAGAGSGGATVLLANICKKIHSFEIDKGNIEVVKRNVQNLGLNNVEINEEDFYSARPKTSADLVLLDLPEPWRAPMPVKLGGYIVAYTPTIIQAQQFVEELPDGFFHERTVEIIDRNWKIQGKAVRPVSSPIGHTGFLTIVRKLID